MVRDSNVIGVANTLEKGRPERVGKYVSRAARRNLPTVHSGPTAVVWM